MMGIIYQTARQVISWMGLSDSLFDLVEEMEYASSLLKHVRFLKSHEPLQQYLENKNTQEPYAEFGEHQSEFNVGLYSIQLLLGERREQPHYWERAWITQEVASARSWIVQCGSSIISDDALNLVAEFLISPAGRFLMGERYEERRLRARIGLDSFISVSFYRCLLTADSSIPQQARNPRYHGTRTLLSFLRRNRSLLCKEAKDKIFSVIGISDLADSRHPGLAIDYARSIATIYTGPTRAIIEVSSNWEVLCSTNMSDRSASLNLPSWVPNWNATKTQVQADKPVSYGHQKATGSKTADFQFWSDGDNQILSATGFCVGTIIGYENAFVHINTDILDHADATTHIIEYSTLYRQLPHVYWRISSILGLKTLSAEAFRRTIVLGLLQHDLNDSFQNILDDLELEDRTDCATSLRPIRFDGMRYRFRTMAAGINMQCLFAIKQNKTAESVPPLEEIIGIAPPDIVEKGDQLCLLLGCSAPLILRPTYDGRYIVVFPAYVDLLMDGTAILQLEGGLFEPQRFDLK